MPFNDYLDHSKVEYSSLNSLFSEILNINERSLVILEALTNSLITKEPYIEFSIKNRSNEVLKYQIPSIYSLVDLIEGLKDELIAIQKSKVLDYTDPVQLENIPIFSEPDNIRKQVIINKDTIRINNNHIFDLFQEKLFSIELDFSNSINPLSKQIKVLKYSIPFVELDESFDLTSNFLEMSTDVLEEFLTSGNIKFIKNESIYELKPLKTVLTGEYKVDKISDIVQLNVPVVDFFGNVSNTVHKSVLQLNNSIVNNNLNGTGRSIVSGDILVNKYNNRYKVMEYEDGKEYNYNEFPIMTLSETFLPSVGDTLHISSDILYERTLEYTINPTSIEFLYFKDLSPNIKIESALYTNVPLIINPKELKTKGLKGEEISIYDYQIKYLYDYQEWITETVKSAMAISRNAGIKPNPPVLLEENFRVVRLNSHRFSNQDPITNDLVSNITFLNSRLSSLESKKVQIIDKMTQWVSDGNSNSSPLYKDYETNLNDLTEKILNTSLKLNEIKSKIIELNIDPATIIKSKYVVEGMWEIVEPQIDIRGRKQDVLQYEVEYSYLNTGKEPNCTPTFNFKTLDGNIIQTFFPKQRYMKSSLREKTFNELSGLYEYEYIYKPDETIDMFNRVEIPINPYEIVMIRVRSISEAGYPSNPLVSDWSNPVYIEFPEQYISIISVENNGKETINNIKENIQFEQVIKSLSLEIEKLKNELKLKVQTVQESKQVIVETCNKMSMCPVLVLPHNTSTHLLQVIDEKLGIFLMMGRDYEIRYSENDEIEIWILEPYLNGLEIGDLLRINFRISV